MAIQLKPIFLSIALFLILSTFFSVSHGQDENDNGAMTRLVKRKLVDIENNASSVPFFTLAANRTHRRDPLNHFKFYEGGWAPLNNHYIASLIFSAAPYAAVAIVWVLVFGVLLLCCCICCCCSRRNKDPKGYSRVAYTFAAIFLILFTLAAIYGCYVMYTGERKFQGSVNVAFDYIVNRTLSIVKNIIEIYRNLSSAKNIHFVNQEFLPAELMNSIDEVNALIKSIEVRPEFNATYFSKLLMRILDPVHLAFLIISIFMLVFAFLGFLFSVLGVETCVFIFALLGWIIITLTCILCGTFFVFHNFVSDTCVAMEDLVHNKIDDASLQQFIPFWNNKLGQNILNTSKVVGTGVEVLMNKYIDLVANQDTSTPQDISVHHNQSGPLVPLLCDPTTQKGCANGEVPLANATEVWKKYVCEVSEDGVCTTVGRLTPNLYNEMTAAVNVSYGLQQSAAFIASVADFSLIRNTFNDIIEDYCPGLRKYSKWVYNGMGIVTVSVMFSLIIWLQYARQSRYRKYAKNVDKGYDEAVKKFKSEDISAPHI